ncbi:hypothetical protein [Nocardia sp. NPDC050710]|uniref:hypothetical protein n=1 Tax=Nocardia sp. NPDC050710 TaxID=3157220 RepID=UPI0033C93BA2
MRDLLRIKAGSVGLAARPVGVRQQLAYLFVVLALRGAYANLDEHRRTMADTPQEVRAQMRTDAEGRFDMAVLDGAPELLAELFEQAVVWSEQSPRAAAFVRQLVSHYRDTEGLLVDVESGTVEIDSRFAGDLEQNHRLWIAERERNHQARAAAGAILRRLWPQVSERVDEVVWVPLDRGHRDAVRARLTALGVDESVCKTVAFVLAYLSGNTVDVNFLEEAPVLVDPGEEIKPAIDGEIRFVQDPEDSWFGDIRDMTEPSPWWESSTALLRADDRDRAAAARASAVLRSGPVSALWPDHVDRRQLQYLLTEYRAHLKDFAQTARLLVDRPAALAGRDWDYLHTSVVSLRHQREALETGAREGLGLLDIERIRLGQVLHECDLGDIDTNHAVFAGALYQRDWDHARLSERGERFAENAAEVINDALRGAGKSFHQLNLDHDCPDEFSDIDEWSILVRLSRITRGGPDREKDIRELVVALDTFLTGAVMNEHTLTLLRRQISAYLELAQAQHDHITANRAKWDERLGAVCAARDAGELRLAPFGTDVTAPQPTPSREPASSDLRSVIGAALPDGIVRQARLDVPVRADDVSDTQSGPEPAAQL